VSRPDQTATELGKIFARHFNDDQALDILFLSPEQDTEVSHVCRPFFQLAPKQGYLAGLIDRLR
jgi:hypothetical protein